MHCLTWAKGAEDGAELAALTASGRSGGTSDSMTPEVPSFLEFLRDHPDLPLPLLPHHLPPPSLSAQAELPKIQPIPGLLSPEHAGTGSTKVLARLCFIFCLQHLSSSVQTGREIVFLLFFCLILCKSLVFAFPKIKIIPNLSFRQIYLIMGRVTLGSFLWEKQKLREGLSKKSRTKDRNGIYVCLRSSLTLLLFLAASEEHLSAECFKAACFSNAGS